MKEINTMAMRHVLRSCLVFIAFAVIMAADVSARQPGDQPNILFIMIDDLGKEWISCYGAEEIETPNLDSLAAGGMK